MSRPRKPTALLEMSGALKRNPKRYQDRADEPRPTTPIGDPPAKFTGRLLNIWHELVAASPEGVLTGSDHMFLANTCRIQFRIESGDCKTTLYSCLRSCLSDLGITPASGRQAQTPQNAHEPGEWGELADSRRRKLKG